MANQDTGMESPPLTNRVGDRQIWLITGVGLLGIVVSALLFHFSREREQRLFEAELQNRAQEQMLAIEREVTTAVVMVRSLAAFHRASEAVSQKQFQEFTELVLARNSTLVSLSFNAYVTADQRASFEQNARREGLAGFQITERDAEGTLVRAGERSEYVAVKYIEPLERNRKAVGFDVASEPVRREALHRARNTGRFAATGRISLVQQNDRQNAVLIFAPVYPRGVSSLPEHVAGFVVGVFRIDELVDQALRNLIPVGIEIVLVDESAPVGSQLLHEHSSGTRQDPVPTIDSSDPLSVSTTMEMGGRRWSIRCRPTEAYLASSHTWAPLAISGTGMMITCLLISYLFVLNRFNRRLHQEVSEHEQTHLAQRKSEERLRLFNRAIESAINGVVIADATKPDHPVIYVNRAFERITGYSAAEIIGGNCRLLQGEDRDQPALEDLRRAIAEGREIRVVLRNYRKDGSLLWNELFLSPVRDDAGNLTHFVSTQNDITERKRAEEERQQLGAKFLHMQKLESLGVMAGGIAHDFNNLLTPILGYSNLVLSQLDHAAPVQRDVRQIQSACLRAAELIKQMLAYSGRGKIVTTRFDISQLIDEMRQFLHAASSTKIDIRYDLAGGLPDVDGDASQIRQVVMNLITNAAEAAENGGEVNVRTGLLTADREFLSSTYVDDQLPEGEYAFMEISDSGCGMDAETLTAIFDPFFTTKFTGRGLGLAAVLGIVRGHRGAIKIGSEPGRGTTVIVLLPHTGTRTSRFETDDSSSRSAKELLFGTVLVVDDDPHVRSVSQQMLEIKGFTVMSAAGGSEAIEVFAKHKHDISAVLLDLTMPRIGGEEVFREIRQLRKDVPVILSSGYHEQELEARFGDQGFSGFLQKPHTMACLHNKLQAVLNARPRVGQPNSL